MELEMKICELFDGLEVEIFGDENLDIQGLSSNSKNISKGVLFIAKNGASHKGSDYIIEALQLGAAAILTDSFQSQFKDCVQVISKKPKEIEAPLADRFYGLASKKLKMIALTGTNGKTSTAYLIRQLLGQDECGLIGTIEYIIGRDAVDATLTTPDVVTNHRMLSEMLKNKMKSAVMEATSIALTQNRLDEIDFDIALFTNFSQDHLDYHKTMEEYLNSKALLFKKLSSDKTALINCDDLASSVLIKECKAKVKTYGTKSNADYQISNIELKASSTAFDLKIENQSYKVKTPLIGMFNVYNTTAAIAVAIEAKQPIDEVTKKAEHFIAPRGRLQSIANPFRAQIFVDFAHTEDALKSVLESLRQIKPKRLITVFGCGGDRDPLKRPFMGKVVADLSDITIITSDNPRSEDPLKICLEVQKGCRTNRQVIVEPDRRKAIQKSLEILEPDDILIIAGRGHEKHQIIKGEQFPFEDAMIVSDLISQSSLLNSK